MPVINTHALAGQRAGAIAAYHETNRIQRAEVDVSGGIDSAVVLALVCRAISPQHVTAVYTGIHSSADSLHRARAAAASCEIALVEMELTGLFDDLEEQMLAALSAAGFDRTAVELRMRNDPTVRGSIRSCLRAPIGRGLNRMTAGGIRHGTGNECEDRFLRFYQKGGDGEVDTNPVAMLTKGEVFQIAHALEVPRIILDAVPSPDLHGIGAAHNDEDELAALYGVRWTYSKVSPDTGEYTQVGTIERMARLLDEPSGEDSVEKTVFSSDVLHDEDLDRIVATALARTFRGFDRQEVHDLVLSARNVERVTRHKWNPNCPGLGDRRELLDAEIITNELPEV